MAQRNRSRPAAALPRLPLPALLVGLQDEPGDRDGALVAVQGHHHSIDGLTPQLLEKKDAADAAPFYLLNKAVLLNDVKKGQPVTLKDVDLSGLEAYNLYLKGLEL